MRARRALALAVMLAPVVARAAPRNADPDWPCQSIKVADMSLGAVWSGPPVDAYAQTWQQDTAVASVAQRVAQRRMTIEDAQAEIARFAAAAGPDRAVKLEMVMAGVFDLLDTERRAVVAGLDRFGRRQKELAASIRGESQDLNTEQTSPTADATRAGLMTERLGWDTRVYDARRQSIEYACAVPTTIEQRLYALAHAIQAALPGGN